ncbi:MAG: ABC transporter ATP-binding protein [Acutalibacter sp.]|jgi:ATP-binding cassette subfamily B multidrug efflux pump
MSEPNTAPRRGPGHGPGHGPMMVGEKAKNFKGSSKKLLSYLRPFWLPLIFVMLFAAASTVFSIVGPKVLALATDELASGLMEMITGAQGGIDFGYIGTVLLGLGGIYLLSAGFSYAQGYIMAGVTADVSYGLRDSIEKKLNRLPLSYFNRVSQGDVLSRITNDVDTLTNSLNQSVTQLITSVCTLIGVLIMMLSISWQLTLVALCIIPVSLAFVMVIVRFSQKHFMDQQNYLGSVNGQVEEMYGGHLIVKAFGREKETVEAFDKENEKLWSAGWKSQFLSGLMMPVMNFVGNLGYVVICMVGAAMAAGGSMTIGGIQAFIQYVRSFTQPITQLANISNQLQMAVAAAERIFRFLDEEEESQEEAKVTTEALNVRGDVTFDHVAFGYGEEPVIKNFSATVKAGQKVAIVGPTGAGKTTMVKLLMRFYDVDSGQITLDGHPITEFSRQDLRSQFGMVLQDAWLYSGTILENIRYGKLTATDEEVMEAARLAQADHFIHTLPGGYHMELNEESTNVSQGQKQLLTIARAILSDAKVMILDEATSSVDTRTEVLIQKAMDNLMKGRTSFIIAHRLSTIRGADLILCMKDGDIVEQGTHEELMEKGGFYAQLYNSQFEAPQEEAV